jgi:sulfide:quinone oxidoreductase
MADGRDQLPRVLIIGGGIAGVEALLAVCDLAGGRVRVKLISAEPEFTYLPELVEEPFTGRPAARTDLALAATELGADFKLGEVVSVDTEANSVKLNDGSVEGYTDLVVCLGGRREPAYSGIPTLLGTRLPADLDGLLRQCAEEPNGTLALIAPPRVTWSLPLYEFALLARHRSAELHLSLRIDLFTPEAAPLAIFGIEASDTASRLLRARGIHVAVRTHVRQDDDGRLVRGGGHIPVDYAAAVALPAIEGPGLAGLPADAHGFIQTDSYGRVRGFDRVHAAGDGTTFPVKQGGVACQQADAVASHIAAKHGADIEPKPFRPVLRGKLITGADSLFMRAPLAGGDGEGTASAEALWEPAIKVAGRYLAPWMQRRTGPPGPLDLDQASPATLDTLEPLKPVETP